MMKGLTDKRLRVLEKIASADVVYCCHIEDKRSMNWLESKGLIFIGFSRKHLTLCARANREAINIIGELK